MGSFGCRALQRNMVSLAKRPGTICRDRTLKSGEYCKEFILKSSDIHEINLLKSHERECAVASELIAHGHALYYYDNRNKGEVDYLIDDYDSLSVIPFRVKSGKDYTVHSALNTFVNNDEYPVKKAFVLSNERTVSTKGKILSIPVYYIMFF